MVQETNSTTLFCHDTKIIIGVGLADSLVFELLQVQASSFIFLYDEKLAETTDRIIGKLSQKVYKYSIVGGEDCKSRREKEKIEDFLFENECQRDCFLIAIGGGTVLDLVGFVAATYMRGVRYCNVPTTLMAMADSSVGGKTGINTSHGKNLLGCFYSPEFVIIDLHHLETLPLRHLRNGIAEIIKASIISNVWCFDVLLLEYLETYRSEILNGSMLHLKNIIECSVQFKIDIVLEDMKEAGKRAILNFGHTIGHAIETLSNDTLHGEAVSIGMAKEVYLSCNKGLCKTAVLSRIIFLLQMYGLPVEMPPNCTHENIYERMRLDKKCRKGSIQMVHLKDFGHVEMNELSLSDLKQLNSKVWLSANRLSFEISSKLKPLVINVPGSKSITNRALLLASLCDRPCVLKNFFLSEDTKIMSLALLSMQVIKMRWVNEDSILVLPNTPNEISHLLIDCGNSGTSARFLASYVSFFKKCGRTTLTGSPRLQQRPMKNLIQALKNAGCDVICDKVEGFLPITIVPKDIRKKVIELESSESSQFVTSLMMMLPVIQSSLIIKKPTVSWPYVEMTVSMMRSFGVSLQIEEFETSFHVRANEVAYQSPESFTIEVDASSCTYPLALAAASNLSLQIPYFNAENQGDKDFCLLLEKMGCQFHIDSDRVLHFEGTNRLKGLGEIDMSKQTDAFMTLAALASLADGQTKITGIANQRLKECNRIEGMVNALQSLGVNATETNDGLIINGPNDIKSDVLKCHDDHRLAMSFSILALKNRIGIDDQFCVSKTWPLYWISIRELIQAESLETKHIALIGMRNCGKSTLGRLAANELGMNFLDLDEEFERVMKSSIDEFVNLNGWEAFRKKEAEIIHQLKLNSPTIIATGGGIVETTHGRDSLLNFNTVFIDRHIEDLLTQQDEKPKYFGSNFTEKYWSRVQNYISCSKYYFPIDKGNFDVELTKSALVEFSESICRHSKQKTSLLKNDPFLLNSTINSVDDTFFLTICETEMDDDVLKRATEGVDAVEIRADLITAGILSELDQLRTIGNLIQRIRTLTKFPIIYTAKTQTLQLMGLKFNVEWIDLQYEETNEEGLWRMIELIPTSTSIILSYHSNNEDKDDSEVLKSMRSFPVDVLKFISKDIQTDENIISFMTGEEGHISRATSKCFTPVTHPLLNIKGHESQISLKEIYKLRSNLKILQPKHFYLIGSPIIHSPSPIIHNAAFEALGLPYSYSLLEKDYIDSQVLDLLANETFGGASITIPLKEKMMKYVEELTPSAAQIGAINTITRNERGLLIGDNTDWIGITRVLSSFRRDIKTALVLGSGGSARAAVYALKHLKIDQMSIFIWNRTTERASSLAKWFQVACTLQSDLKADIIISTIPHSAQEEVKINPYAKYLLDLSYRKDNQSTHFKKVLPSGKYLEGMQVLLEQAFYQSM